MWEAWGVLVSLWLLGHVVIFVYGVVSELRENGRIRRGREHVAWQVGRTIDAVDDLTERAVAQMMAEAMRRRAREAGWTP